MSIIRNPSNDVLKEIASNYPNAIRTAWGNLSIKTRITARSSQFTFFVSDTPLNQPFISRNSWEQLVSLQDAYISKSDMIEITGSIGVEPPVAVQAKLMVEKSAANIAAMQCQLYFSDIVSKGPVLSVIYTPGLLPTGFSHPILIAVDMESYTTRIFGTDYFGESKKAGLRMWNKWVYDQGGLALHAGCKTYFDSENREKSAIIIGLSGTGKTTTTLINIMALCRSRMIFARFSRMASYMHPRMGALPRHLALKKPMNQLSTVPLATPILGWKT